MNIESLTGLLSQVNKNLEMGYLDEAAGLLNTDLIEEILCYPGQDISERKILFELAELLTKVGREEYAERCYRKLLDRGPDAAVYNKLGCLYLSLGRLNEGLQYQLKAVEVMPNSPELLANLARAQMETGDLENGIGLLRRAVQLMPDNAQAHSNLLFRLHQLPKLDPAEIYNEHLLWGRRHAPADMARVEHDNVVDPQRRLRVGYISPDFRRHSVSYFFEPLLDGHNRDNFTVFGYGNVEYPDQITERLKHKFDYYRNIFGVSDYDVSSMIENDRIDILVDLAGHVGDNRLLVMARKPAPVQVTYLGYPDTTGLSVIDYRLTDSLADTDDLQQYYSEKLVFLRDGFLCYKPPDFAPSVAPLPAEINGYTTYGSFNNSCKLNNIIIGLWAEILRADTQSRFLLKIKGGEESEIAGRFIRQFTQESIDPSRITIMGWKSPVEHFNAYGQVDISLDTYPYNGTTTTCEALWMGVPTISLVGFCHASRVGLSLLSRLGLEFFAATSPQEYIAKACALSSNRSALSRLRTSMRARIASSGLCHGKAFAREVEAVYRVMWLKWCRSRGLNSETRLLHNQIEEISDNQPVSELGL